MRTGVASFTLDSGRCPPWLFERMVKLARVITIAIVSEFGEEEFLKRLADPVWFQSFGTVLAFDWNASGLTTTTLGALKVALWGLQRQLGVFVCGGKGKTSRKTPEEILTWSNNLGFSQKQADDLIYASRASAKVDSALIQDGFTLYHHSFLFTKTGKWTVVQQGMNTVIQRARRYHWSGKDISDFIEEPHSGIFSQVTLPTVLNLTAKKSDNNRETSLGLIHSSSTLYRDLAILSGRTNLQPMFKILDLPNFEFHSHPVEQIDFESPRLYKNLEKIIIGQPKTFEKLLMTPGVGGKTIRALSLVAEIIYGAKPSYEDPARYSFAHGGKDGIPYPVDRKTYDQTLRVLENAIKQSPFLSYKEKEEIRKRARTNFMI